MLRKVPGFAFRLTGLILGCVALSIAVTGIVFSAIGFHKARLCKHCKLQDEFH